MKYKRVVAYIPDTSVLFELTDGNFALVSVDDENRKNLITVSGYAESHLKFGGFVQGEGIPSDTLSLAKEILEREERVFICSDVKKYKRGRIMQTVRLGKTELVVSKNGFGALPIQRVGSEEATHTHL